jgi:hypothetical protein
MGACPSGRAAVQCPSWALETDALIIRETKKRDNIFIIVKRLKFLIVAKKTN